MYIGLWTRIEGFERDDLSRALERRTVVQGTLLRGTIRLVSARDYWPLAAAIAQARRDWSLGMTRSRLTVEEVATAAATLRARLKDGPLRRKDIEELLGKPLAGAVVMWLELLRVPPSGTWERRRADLYAAAAEWLEPAEATREEGTDLIVRRYLGGFGPAAAGDIASWAGLPVASIEPALERIGPRRFRDEQGRELLDLPTAALPHPDTDAPVRFLPTWDATLLVHARRTGILPEEHRRGSSPPRPRIPWERS